jgi:hypothetical protein
MKGLAWLGVIAAVLGAEFPVTTVTPSPMDQAVVLLTEARQAFRKVQDYQCTLIKQERVQGVLLPEQVLTMKVRNQPYGVCLHWLSPDSLKGQEVCFAAGHNRGQMRVHPAGVLGIVGYVSVDPLDPRVFRDNRHPITEAGMGYLLDNTARYWEMERRLKQTQVRITDGVFNRRPCIRIETIHPDRNGGRFYAYRCVMYLDKATQLPVRVEAYDWPRSDGPLEGDLLECYSFLDLRGNLGLVDGVFCP